MVRRTGEDGRSKETDLGEKERAGLRNQGAGVVKLINFVKENIHDYSCVFRTRTVFLINLEHP